MFRSSLARHPLVGVSLPRPRRRRRPARVEDTTVRIARRRNAKYSGIPSRVSLRSSYVCSCLPRKRKLAYGWNRTRYPDVSIAREMDTRELTHSESEAKERT